MEIADYAKAKQDYLDQGHGPDMGPALSFYRDGREIMVAAPMSLDDIELIIATMANFFGADRLRLFRDIYSMQTQSEEMAKKYAGKLAEAWAADHPAVTESIMLDEVWLNGRSETTFVEYFLGSSGEFIYSEPKKMAPDPRVTGSTEPLLEALVYGATFPTPPIFEEARTKLAAEGRDASEVRLVLDALAMASIDPPAPTTYLAAVSSQEKRIFAQAVEALGVTGQILGPGDGRG